MKFSVTPELALLLKTLHAQSSIPAKDLAEKVGKSPSYISKLENGEVKSIQKDVLVRMLSIVAGGGDFFEEVLPTAARVLRSFMEPKRLLSQVWLLQLDVVERTVVIPAAMAADVKAQLSAAGETLSGLVDMVNRNEDSGLPESFPANEVTVVDYEGTPRFTVRVVVDETRVEQAFSKEVPVLSYLAVNDLVFALFRRMRFPSSVGKTPPEEAVIVLRCTASYMEQWGLHSLTGFSHLISSDEFIERQEPLTRSNPRIVQRIADLLEELSQHEAVVTTNQLNAFYEMLQWDPAFALKLVSMPFSDLGEMGFRTKSRLLADIQELIDRYDQLPDLEKRFETY